MDIYIDESGSITEFFKRDPYFIIAFFIPDDKDNMKKIFRRYISKNINKFKKDTRYRIMFHESGKFKELKGSCMTFGDKKDFLDYFCQRENWKVFYARLNNSRANSDALNNTARSFNYLIKSALEKEIMKNFIDEENFNLQIDNRNVKLREQFFLEEYLNTEIGMETGKKFNIIYFESEDNTLIQVADVLANILFSSHFKKEYAELIKKMKDEKFLVKIMEFPI